MSAYLSPEFATYVDENYVVENTRLLKNSAIMQMIYALEWYDIPRSHYSSLIEFHPYLTEQDQESLWYVDQQHIIENSISMVLFSLVANRLLQQAGPSIFKRRIGRWPCALLTAGSLSYALNVAVFRQIQQNDYKELGLDKYYSLDLNADMMQKDLEERFNIRVKAQHFDLEQAQARVDLEEQER